MKLFCYTSFLSGSEVTSDESGSRSLYSLQSLFKLLHGMVAILAAVLVIRLSIRARAYQYNTIQILFKVGNLTN